MHVEIRIRGSLKQDWSDWLDGLSVSNQENQETVLTGLLPDQAALLGLLNRIHGLNLQLLAFFQSDDESGRIFECKTGQPEDLQH